MTTPASIGDLFRSLGLSLTIRALPDDDETWGCTLTKHDGTTFEIDSVSFFDVDPDTGEEWIVEPTPSRVLSVLAGDDIEDEDGEDGEGGDASAEASAAARAFLGDEGYALLLDLDEAGLD
jgi:hypothetical protein